MCIDLVGAVNKMSRARSKEEKAMWAKVFQEESRPSGYVLGELLDHPPLSAGEARTLGNVVRQRAGRAEQTEKADVKEARRLPTGPVREKAVGPLQQPARRYATQRWRGCRFLWPAARASSLLPSNVRCQQLRPPQQIRRLHPRLHHARSKAHGPTSKSASLQRWRSAGPS